MIRKNIYLDYAASTPIDPKLLDVMNRLYLENFYNPSEIYTEAQNAKQILEEARNKVAQVLGVKSTEVIFTSGGTEGNNLALQGIMGNWPEANLIVSAIEHDSIFKPAKEFNLKICPVTQEGILEIEKLKKLIDQKTVLISVMLVNNEIGVINDLNQIAKLIQQIKAERKKLNNDLPLYLHTDACQAPNYLNIKPSSWGVDLMTLNGCKIYGPKQTGALYIKSGTKIKPLILGGGQEFNLRSGTENVPGNLAFSIALENAQKRHKKETQRLEKIRDYFINEILKLPQVKINGSLKKRIANNINLTISGIDNEWLILKLDQAGILVSSSSACNALKDDLSHVLKAISLNEEAIKNTIRISLGRQTTLKDIKYLLKILKEII